MVTQNTLRMFQKATASAQIFPKLTDKNNIMEKVMKLIDVNGQPTAYLHIHLIIFLELDPKSLKTARQVSKEWDHFIRSQLWMNKNMRKRLEKRLVKQWRMNQPMRRDLELGGDTVVDMICCNETHVAVFCRVVGAVRMRVRLYSLNSLSQVCEERDTGMAVIGGAPALEGLSCAMGKLVFVANGEWSDGRRRKNV